MAKKKEPIKASELEGFKYFKMLSKLLKRLEAVGTARDKANSRKLFCDDYVSLLLLYFFNSIAHTAWALWSTEQPAAKLHLHFSVFEGAPRQAIVTPGKCSEPEVLRNRSKPDGFM